MHEYDICFWLFSLDKISSLMKPSTKTKRVMNDPHTHRIETILRHVTKIFFCIMYISYLSCLSLSPFIHSSLPHGWARKNTRIQSISIKICEWPNRVSAIYFIDNRHLHYLVFGRGKYKQIIFVKYYGVEIVTLIQIPSTWFFNIPR